MDSEDYYFIVLILGLYPIFYIILRWLFGNSIIFRIAFTFVTVDIEISISCFIIGGMGIEHVFMWGLPLTLVCFGLAYWHIYSVVRLPLLDITSDISRLAKGEVDSVSERELLLRKDEIGQIQVALKAYSQAVSRTADFASKVQEGVLSSNFDSLGPDDLLGNSLIEMNQRLAEVIRDTNRIVKLAAEEGVFDMTLSTEKSQGAWRELADTVNSLLASLLGPIREINQVIDAMADGDLTHHFRLSSQGEIGNLATNLNAAIDKLNSLIEEIRSVSIHLSNNTEILVENNLEMTHNTNEIALSIGKMSEGARHQLKQIDQSSSLVEHVMQLSEEISSQSQEIYQFAKLGAREGKDGLVRMDLAVEAMKNLLEEANSAVAVLEKFHDRSRKISGIVNLIKNISQQTNLLSLNASIEAAKAGDAGRGFSVVADQISQLASSTKVSAAEVGLLITEIMDDTENVLTHIQSIERIGNKSATSVFQASGTFTQIAQLSDQSLIHTSTIQSNSQLQLDEMRTVVNAIEGIVIIAEETATGTDQMAASASELSAGMTEFHQRFAALGRVSEQLKEQVAHFKLEVSKKIFSP